MDFEELERESKKRQIESDFMLNILKMMSKQTGDQKAKLLELSIEINNAERQIMDCFIGKDTKSEEKIDKAVNFFTQINQLYADFKEELNIK